MQPAMNMNDASSTNVTIHTETTPHRINTHGDDISYEDVLADQVMLPARLQPTTGLY